MTEKDLIKIIENYNQSGKEDTYNRCGLFSGAIENIKTHITKSEEFKEFFELSKKVNLYKNSFKPNLEEKNIRELLVIFLLENIYHHFFSVYKLTLYGLCFESGILLRAILENFTHLKMITCDENYHMKYDIHLKEKRIKLIKQQDSITESQKKDIKSLEKDIEKYRSVLNLKSKDNGVKIDESIGKVEDRIKHIENYDRNTRKLKNPNYKRSFLNAYRVQSSLIHGDYISIAQRFNGDLSIRLLGLQVSPIKNTLFLNAAFLMYSSMESLEFLKLKKDSKKEEEIAKILERLGKDISNQNISSLV